jgi:tetratricopeptide (TPR) repeat protein
LPTQRRSALATNVSATPEAPAPTTPRGFFNAGTKQLQGGKLREAEASLESALASQKPGLQPVALYNLGHVRFKQGIEQLMKGPAAKPAAARARQAGEEVNEAVRLADEALAGNDVPKMVEAYMRGRGARKEARAATKAVRQALEAHGATMTKWQRAEGDFKSTLELKTSDADARHNVEVVDRCLAKLVDSMQEMQQAAAAAGEKNQELGDKLSQLKGRIPAPDMPPGGAGDDEEDEDNPFGPKPGDQEGPSKDGKEMALSPEQAGFLLDAFRPGGDRRLPMSQDGKAEPKDPKKPTW